MLGSPVCSGAVGPVKPHVPALNVRQPFRLQSLTARKCHTPASAAGSCCFKSRPNISHTVCKSSSHDSAGSNSTDLTPESLLKKAVKHSWAPLAVALPVCFGYGGSDGNGFGGGGGGDGDGSGGSGQGNNTSRNVIADIAEDDDDDEDEDEDEEEGDDEEEEEDDEVSLFSAGNAQLSLLSHGLLYDR